MILPAVAGVLYLFWRWVTRSPGLPVQPFWSRSKLVACVLFLVVYVPFAVVLPPSEFDTWGDFVASYGWASLLIILFPEINRMFVSSATVDNLMSLEVTRGLGWAIFSIWLLVTMAIVLGFLF